MALHTYSVEAEMLNASTDKNKLKAVGPCLIHSILVSRA